MHERRRLLQQWKRAARERDRATLGLPAHELEDLAAHLEASLERDGCDHSYVHTLSWYEQHDRATDHLAALFAAHAVGCDCEFYANLVSEVLAAGEARLPAVSASFEAAHEASRRSASSVEEPGSAA